MMLPYHHLRMTQLKALLANYCVHVLIIEDPLNLYYLTGRQLSAGTLIITPEQATLLVDGRYFTDCQQHVTCDVLLASEEVLKNVLNKPEQHAIGIDADLMTLSRYHTLSNLCQNHQTLVALNSPLDALRLIKDEDELQLLRQAAALCSAGYDYVCTLVKPGCSEEEIAHALEIFWKQQGAEGPSFAPIIAFGANSALPHHRAGKSRLKSSDIILIDIGVQLQHYHSDMTRVLFVGETKQQLHDIYHLVHSAQTAALQLCRAGVSAGTLDTAARDVIAKAGYVEYFTHSLGHGVGLAIHEAPRLTSRAPAASFVLQAGMVVTIEPGIYLPNLGGVRLENTVIVTKEGYEDLTQRPYLPQV